jgi:hypothetical protein
VGVYEKNAASAYFSQIILLLVQNQRSKVECIEKRLCLEVSAQTASQDR